LFIGTVSDLDEDHRQAQADGGLDLLRHGQKRAHAQEEGQRHVLDEDRRTARFR
jgi:hypothetical protein